jgi:hypothetical protein
MTPIMPEGRIGWILPPRRRHQPRRSMTDQLGLFQCDKTARWDSGFTHCRENRDRNPVVESAASRKPKTRPRKGNRHAVRT